MQVLLDSNNYWTGTYCEIGSIDGGVEVSSLPDETDISKQVYYKYSDGTWTFDTDKYTAAALEAAKKAKIAELKVACDAACVGGFSSSATGTTMWYDSDTETQTILTAIYTLALSNSTAYDGTTFVTGVTVGTVPIRAKASESADDTTKAVQYITSAMALILGKDFLNDYATKRTKLWAYETKVAAATDLATVTAIIWA